MKRIIAAAASAAIILAGAIPALADDHHDGDRHNDNHARTAYRHAAPPPRRVAVSHRYHEGQMWHGHPLVYRGGNWGYYQPHNGAQFFIQIPL